MPGQDERRAEEDARQSLTDAGKSMEKRTDFDIGFDKFMSSAIEHELLKRAGKPIPKELQDRLNESGGWIRGLADEEYSRLIH